MSCAAAPAEHGGDTPEVHLPGAVPPTEPPNPKSSLPSPPLSPPLLHNDDSISNPPARNQSPSVSSFSGEYYSTDEEEEDEQQTTTTTTTKQLAAAAPASSDPAGRTTPTPQTSPPAAPPPPPLPTTTPLRISLFLRPSTTTTKPPTGRMARLPVGTTLPDLQRIAAAKLRLSLPLTLFFPDGAELDDDLDVLADGDVLHVQPSSSSSSPTSTSTAPANPPIKSSAPTLQTCSKGRTDWVRLNVGGQVFATTRSTLLRDPDSMLARMFGSSTGGVRSWSSLTDASGAYLIDRSPEYFAPLLHFLRNDQMVLNPGLNPEGVLQEARFFNLASAVEALEPLVAERGLQSGPAPIRRKELVRLLMLTASTASLRCQGMTFAGSDLSSLDLRYINFRNADLSGVNLSHCNLEYCNFERANLQGAILDYANLLGCSLARAVLDNASLRSCNLNDPSQRTVANLEGAKLRDCNLEDCNLAGANLRAASLKNSNLKNSNLRCANLAGSDLSSCDLTGCNLQAANLRGANTVGARFHFLPAAVHMSQSVFSHVGPPAI